MKIQNRVNLKNKNWFQTGGHATFFCAPETTKEFQGALKWSHENNKKIIILGQGANSLISDDDIDDLIIRPELTEIKLIEADDNHVLVNVGAGTSIAHLISYCLDHNVIGLEEFSGIPGTVGGATYNNLHYYEFSLEQFLVEATVIEKKTGLLLTVNKEWFNFGYDHSTLHEKNYFLVDATFIVKKADNLEIAYARGRRNEIIRHRVNRFPFKNTCGCFFRNFHDYEVSLECNNKKMIHVAYYLDKIGARGSLRIGDACVSHQHANMIVNMGNATTNDIIKLARTMQELVKKEYGIIPQPECELIGFKKYPLL